MIEADLPRGSLPEKFYYHEDPIDVLRLFFRLINFSSSKSYSNSLNRDAILFCGKVSGGTP